MFVCFFGSKFWMLRPAKVIFVNEKHQGHTSQKALPVDIETLLPPVNVVWCGNIYRMCGYICRMFTSSSYIKVVSQGCGYSSKKACLCILFTDGLALVKSHSWLAMLDIHDSCYVRYLGSLRGETYWCLWMVTSGIIYNANVNQETNIANNSCDSVKIFIVKCRFLP